MRKGVAICDGHARRPLLALPRAAAAAGVPAGAAERQHHPVRQLPAHPLLRPAPAPGRARRRPHVTVRLALTVTRPFDGSEMVAGAQSKGDAAVALWRRPRRRRDGEHRRRIARQSRSRRLRRPHRAGRRHHRRVEGGARRLRPTTSPSTAGCWRRCAGPPTHGVATLHIRSDSELLVKQMRGEYRVKNPGLQPLYEEARALVRRSRPRHVRARAPRVQQGRRPPRQRGDGRGPSQ